MRAGSANRWVTALGLAGALLLGSANGAKAQSEESESHDRIQGSWHVQFNIVDCATGVTSPGPPLTQLLAFAHGGTVSGATDESLVFQPGQLSSEYGTWKHTGGHTYTTVREALILFTTPFFSEGTQRSRQTIELDNDIFTVTGVTQFLDLKANVIRSGCTRGTAQRLR